MIIGIVSNFLRTGRVAHIPVGSPGCAIESYYLEQYYTFMDRVLDGLWYVRCFMKWKECGNFEYTFLKFSIILHYFGVSFHLL